MEPTLQLTPDETETIKRVWFENERIYMLSSSDKAYSRPLEAFPILKEASEEERNAFIITHHGTALRWKALDEDIHISSFFINVKNGLNPASQIGQNQPLQFFNISKDVQRYGLFS